MCYTGHNFEVNWEKSRAEMDKFARRISQSLAQNFENFDAEFHEA